MTGRLMSRLTGRLTGWLAGGTRTVRRSGRLLVAAGVAVLAAVSVAAGSVLTGRLVGVVAAGLVLVVVLVLLERAHVARSTGARAGREASTARARAAAVVEAERTHQAWRAALAEAGLEPTADDCDVSLWEWTCAGCRLACAPVPDRDEAAFLAGEHDRVHHGRRPSAHVHRIARLLFPLDLDGTPEVTPWPDAA